jgi:hypothetical protein
MVSRVFDVSLIFKLAAVVVGFLFVRFSCACVD